MHNDFEALDGLVELRTERSGAVKDGAKPYLGLEHLGSNFGGILGSSSAADSSSVNSAFEAGDILFGKLRPALRKCEQVTFAGYCSTDLLVLRARSGVEPGYATHVLRSQDVFAAAIRSAEGTKMPRTSWSKIRTIPVYAPSLGAQRRMAEILDSVDESIRSTERLISKIEETNQCASRALLDGFQQIQVPVPMRPLGTIGRIRSGSTPSRAQYSRYYAKGNVPWVKTLDLNEDVITSTDERITSAAVSEYSCPILPPDTVLVAMYGGWAQIGRTAVLGMTASTNQAISAIEVEDAEVDPAFLQLALQLGRHRWKAIAASTRKDPNITRADVLAFEVPIVDRDAQQKILTASQSGKLRINAERKRLAKLRSLKEGLMEDLLTGPVRVKVGEA